MDNDRLIPLGKHEGCSVKSIVANLKDHDPCFDKLRKYFISIAKQLPNQYSVAWSRKKTAYAEMMDILTTGDLYETIKIIEYDNLKTLKKNRLQAAALAPEFLKNIMPDKKADVELNKNDKFIGRYVGITRTHNIKFQVNKFTIICVPVKDLEYWKHVRLGTLYKFECSPSWQSPNKLYYVASSFTYHKPLNFI